MGFARPLAVAERPQGGPGEPVLTSLAAGLLTAAGSAFLFLLTLAAPPNGVFPSDRLWIYLGGLNVYGYLEIAVLLVAYVALSVIDGILYGIVVPEEKSFVFK